MNLFRLLLGTLLVGVCLYTLPVVMAFGLAPLFPTFFGDIGQMTWPGQFNLDFLGFLILSGFWMAWRNNFSPFGLVLGAFGLVGRIPLLTTYLLYLSFATGGDVKRMLLGDARGAS